MLQCMLAEAWEAKKRVLQKYPHPPLELFPHTVVLQPGTEMGLIGVLCHESTEHQQRKLLKESEKEECIEIPGF